MDTTDGESKFASFSLYHHMCKHVVGTEKHVRTIRLVNTVINNLSYNINNASITSGSFGEGLWMRGSDRDMMFVTKILNVLDETENVVINPTKTYFSLMTEETKPGFVMLRLISGSYPGIRSVCEQFRMEYYLSNALFKQLFLADCVPVEHGPCLSDREGLLDIAYCLRGRFWVKSASEWIKRSNNVWPNKHTKQMIINHGVIFVPIGSKGSLHEELEWRVSFSVGEKFLMYSFSHTQLLCYALMKILLKDVINCDSRCEDLICSYYLKTIIFWISEELHPSVWKPGNLIRCFMTCFHRLIYCVQYQVCPHYFISEYNLFENKIEGLNKDYLVDTLRLLLSYKWRCIIFSEQISHFLYMPCNFESDKSCLYYEDINKFLSILLFLPVLAGSYDKNSFSRAVYNIISCNSKRLKYIHTHFMSLVCKILGQAVYSTSTTSNKNQYKKYITRLNYLLMNINHDTVSGWLMLASLFYKENQYGKSLIILMYALSKCTPEKNFREPKLSVTKRHLIKWSSLQKHGVVRLLKFLYVDCVFFQNSTLIPMELLIKKCLEIKIPPVVYAHFLSFLCHYHLNNVPECKNSFRDLQLTISEDYFIGIDICLNAFSYYCLGTALQMMGDNVLAKQAFTETAELLYSHPFILRPLTRLSMIASL